MGQSQGPTFMEHADVTQVYCSGAAHVFIDGNNLHASFYQEHQAGDGTRERVIVLRLVIPVKAMMQGREFADFAIAENRAHDALRVVRA